MTDEVDPRLVALGLVPAPPGWREHWREQQEQAEAHPAPPEPPMTAAPPSFAPPPSAAPSSGEPPPLFAGMGKFTGMPPEASAAQPAAPPQFTAPATPPAYTPPAYTPPAYTPPPPQPAAPEPEARSQYMPTPVAPPAPEAPIREAPPPLPPLASAMPTATAVEAPPIPTKKEKAKKEKKEKPAKAEKAPKPVKVKVAKPEKVKPPPKPRFVLPPSGVLLRGPIVMGYPEKKLQITLEQLGFRINGVEPIDVAWSDIKEIKTRRGKVSVRIKNGRPVAFAIPVEGVAEPTLAGPLARVVKEASSGSLDLAGSAFLELQNATDSLKDHFHDEDDPLVPSVVGLVFGLAGLTFTALLPDTLAIATRTPVAAGAYLIDSPLAGFDPRVLVAAFAAAAMLAAGIVRVAMGKAATAWARGTLRGWHEGARRPVDVARRGLAAIILNPAISAAVLLLAIVTILPSTRVQTVIDPGGIHIMREVFIFDDDRPWSSVTKMETVPAPTVQHFEGVAVVFHFENKSPVSTLDGRLRGGTDKQLLASATAWKEGRTTP
ncbi:MAG TPA: hypothetical protein VGR87_10195 [Candidatus Limnocylindria bacterium]|jgi:hypothetical protein|nr:hypothetical protein [Candidatus Limnocylindria bacterium]